MKKHLKKILFATALTLGLSFLIVQPAHALSIPGIPSIGEMVGWILYAVMYLASYIGGVAVSVLGWATGVVLDMGLHITNSDPVNAGFPITLAIANLGFVLAIIMIAIATILRNQTYGVKTFLYKVVVMAVLVNFGLVIAGGLVNISDSMTTYFLNSITGGEGSSGFASRMMGAFQPQQLFSPESGLSSSSAAMSDMQGAGNSLAGVIKPLTALVMTVSNSNDNYYSNCLGWHATRQIHYASFAFGVVAASMDGVGFPVSFKTLQHLVG